MNNLVSVIISAYNHEKYVQDTIKSIIEQTYKNIELIIIDDGSKDSTYEKILELKDECQKRFPNVYFEKQENAGFALTLNKLLQKAQGEYIYIIASDDLAKPNSIELQVKFLSKNAAYGLAVGNNEIIDTNGKICYWDKDRNIIYDKNEAKYKTFVEFLNKDTPYFYNRKFGTYPTLYNRNYIPNGYMIRKKLFDIIEPFTKKAPLEDYFLMLQLSKYCKFKYINKVLFSYRWHDNNSIKNEEKINNYARITKEYEEEILNKIDRNQVFKEVLEVLENGALCLRQGIPYIFEIQNYKKAEYKYKILKIFNIKILKFREVKIHNKEKNETK